MTRAAVGAAVRVAGERHVRMQKAHNGFHVARGEGQHQRAGDLGVHLVGDRRRRVATARRARDAS